MGEEQRWIPEDYWTENSRVPQPGETYFHYRLEELISDSHCGFVFVATDLNVDNKKCVKFTKRFKGSEERIENEVQILRSINHPHIIQLEFHEYLPPYMVSATKYYSNGSLFGFMSISYKEGFGDELTRQLFPQMLDAVNYLHKCGIWHRDIKLQNFLVDEWTPRKKTIVLADFGFAKRFPEGTQSNEILGTKGYMAPEMFQPKATYDQSIDIWALGITFYNMLVFLRPLPNYQKRPVQFVSAASKGKFFMRYLNERGISHEAQQYFLFLCRPKPYERPSAEQALQSEWLCQEKPELEQSITDIIMQPNDDYIQTT